MADAMLGRLARWLRLLGFDTLYPGGHEDIPESRALLVQAIERDRLLLTRDEKLGGHPTARFISSGDIMEQLRELDESLGPKFHTILKLNRSLCSLCNGSLQHLEALFETRSDLEMNVTTCKSKAATLSMEIWAKLPDGVRLEQKQFWRCMDCQKLYWKGTHWASIEAVREQLLELRSIEKDQGEGSKS